MRPLGQDFRRSKMRRRSEERSKSGRGKERDRETTVFYTIHRHLLWVPERSLGRVGRSIISSGVTHLRDPKPETEEEKMLKEEIDNLKKELEKNSKPNSESAGDQLSLSDKLVHKERELEMLIQDLENKVRFGQKVVERPGSGAVRTGGFPDGPPSQSGSIDGSRSVEFVDRSRSYGTADAWTRPGDDRRGFQGGFQGGRDRGFLGNRDMDRPRSRERW